MLRNNAPPAPDQRTKPSAAASFLFQSIFGRCMHDSTHELDVPDACLMCEEEQGFLWGRLQMDMRARAAFATESCTLEV